MDKSMFVFASDLRDEGIDVVIENLQERAGLDRLAFAAMYHDSRDLFTHNPRHVVLYNQAGAAGFEPSPNYYDRLRPLASKPSSPELLDALVDRAQSHQFAVDAWVVFLHDDRLGFENPDCVQRNAFGDVLLTSLCPTHPDVQRYVHGVVEDICARGVRTIIAESLHYHGIRHNAHHERYFDPPSPFGLFLLGICFCTHCRTHAEMTGIDCDLLQTHVRSYLHNQLQDAGSSKSGSKSPEIWPMWGDLLLDYLNVRQTVLGSLVRSISSLADRHGVKLILLDMPSHVPRPTTLDKTNADISANYHLPDLLNWIHLVEYPAYLSDPMDFIASATAYAQRLTSPARMAVALRPMPPDTITLENLATKVAGLMELGVNRLDFYHYGLARLSSLDWIRTACQTQ